MRKIVYRLIVLLAIGYSVPSFSQPISKSDFKNYFTQGNLMLLDHYYDTAVRTFLYLHKKDPSNANINYKIGICYLHLPSEKVKAIPFLENALRQTVGNYREDDPNEKNAPEDVLYHLGQAYHYAYRFDEAIANYTKFRDLIGKWNINFLKEIDRKIEVSKNAKELTSRPVECTISNLGDSVNSDLADYSPVISADESMLVFTSRRMGTGGKENITLDDLFFEDIWICKQGKYGTWTRAKNISKSINTDGNEATIGLAADGQQLYVYRDDNGDGNIYISKLDGEYWNAPYKMEAANVNSTSWEPSACVSADGNTMFFVSNRDGGIGGRDIYRSTRLPNRSWSEPENLGPTINTPYDDDAPFMHPDGITFFFSSNGHNSMGGFDIFSSTNVARNVWTTPVNMGYPINTTDDDIYFVTSSDGKRAYYASLRPEGKGEKDIYMVSLPKPITRPVAILVGYLKNRDGSYIPKNSSVTATTKDGRVITCKPNEATGKFVQSLLPGLEYEISVEANGNKVFSDKFFLPEDSSYQRLGRGFFQRVIYLGDTTRIFSATKADTSSKKELVSMNGKLLLSLKADDAGANVGIQLLNSQGNTIASAVTDSKGDFTFNNIDPDQSYILKIDENDPILKTNKTFFLAKTNGEAVAKSEQDGKFFLFKNIPADINKLKPINSKDSSALPAPSMEGKLAASADGKKGISETPVTLSDSQGNKIASSKTDKEGAFTFKNLSAGSTYGISVDQKEPSLGSADKLFLINQKGKIVRVSPKDNGFFVYKNLPVDLNSLPALTVSDDSKLASMKGKLLHSIDSASGIGNLDITILDASNKEISRTKTNPNGEFTFENLSTNKNYTVKLNGEDPLLASYSKVYLADADNKIVKTIDLKKGLLFRNLPTDLSRLNKLSESELGIIAPLKKADAPLLEGKYDFIIYFPYNKKDVDISASSYLALIEKVEKMISEKGSVTIEITASSSTVPTKSFPDNLYLANLRANEVKDKIHASAGWKNIDLGKIKFVIVAKVQGPEYKNDAVQNRAGYEKWQFIKVIVQ